QFRLPPGLGIVPSFDRLGAALLGAKDRLAAEPLDRAIAASGRSRALLASVASSTMRGATTSFPDAPARAAPCEPCPSPRYTPVDSMPLPPPGGGGSASRHRDVPHAERAAPSAPLGARSRDVRARWPAVRLVRAAVRRRSPGRLRHRGLDVHARGDRRC